MASHPRAIVIGGGLIGCMSAYYLAREGWRVRLLERGRLGSGASFGNCGFVCPSHVMPLAIPGAISHTLRVMMKKDSPIAIRKWGDISLWGWFAAFSKRCRREPMMQAAQGRHALLSASMQLYRELVAEERLNCDWQDQGLLMVYKSRRDFEDFSRTAELLGREFGVISTPYPAEEVTRLEATLRPGLAGGWHFPGDAHVRPDRLLAALRGAIENLGVEIEEGVSVRALQIQGKRLTGVETSSGVEHADVVVLATGAEAPAFAKPLGCRIPIQPGKGYSITMRAPSLKPRIPMIFEEHHVAVTPFSDALRIGSTMEFAGYDRSIRPDRIALLRKSAEQHLVEAPRGEDAEEWAGWRPMIYDGLPCIDRAPGAENVIVAAGNGMIGLASAPATGKLVAQLACRDTPHIDPEPYSLRRFR